jgi:NB-ARC domain
MLAAPAPPNYELGLSLSGAPQIDDSMFVGRDAQVTQMEEWLSPTSSVQNVVVISGLGGIGKTQLCIHYAKRYHHLYSSIIWLNAKDESTLKAGLVSLASRIMNVVKLADEEQAVHYVRRWLSESENKKWLIIYDNFEDPYLPEIPNPAGYDIQLFFPYREHGSILITTRSSQIKFGNLKVLPLEKLKDPHQRLAILSKRSGRKTEGGEQILMSYRLFISVADDVFR